MSRTASAPKIFWLGLPFLLYALGRGIYDSWFMLNDGAHNGADSGFFQMFAVVPILFLIVPVVALLFWLFFGSSAAIITAMVLVPYAGLELLNLMNALTHPSVNQVFLTSVIATTALIATIGMEAVAWRDLRGLNRGLAR